MYVRNESTTAICTARHHRQLCKLHRTHAHSNSHKLSVPVVSSVLTLCSGKRFLRTLYTSQPGRRVRTRRCCHARVLARCGAHSLTCASGLLSAAEGQRQETDVVLRFSSPYQRHSGRFAISFSLQISADRGDVWKLNPHPNLLKYTGMYLHLSVFLHSTPICTLIDFQLRHTGTDRRYDYQRKLRDASAHSNRRT
jgi:hypothetical protein